MKKVPKVSIGMPLYNAEDYLELAINDLLNQDFQDFELIISDNNSLDNTKEIALKYQKIDKRIKFYENNHNIGPSANFDKVFYLSSGKYFMWSAHDDRHDKTFISKCLKKLEENSDAVLANTQWYWINEDGNHIKEMQNCYNGYGIDTTGLSILERFESLFKYKNWTIFYGLIRSDALKKCLPNQNEYGGDILLLTKLILLGDFVNIPEKLFSYMYVPKDVNEYLSIFLLKSNQNLKAFSGMVKSIYKIINETSLDINLREKLTSSFINILKVELYEWFFFNKR
jgi:glycosyltransferase involved in cell wall biosynthesis